MSELTVLCYLWGDPSKYNALHVNRLYRACKKHLHTPFRFVVVTNARETFDEGIEEFTFQSSLKWTDIEYGIQVARVLHAGRNYPRLMTFDPKFQQAIGITDGHILQFDLDLVITDDITPLVEERPDIKLLKGMPTQPYNFSILLLKAGAHSEVFSSFPSGHEAEESTLAKGYTGCDQAWIAHVLGEKLPTWDRTDGITNFILDMKLMGSVTRLPEGTRIVNFAGNNKPSQYETREWVKVHWVGLEAG